MRSFAFRLFFFGLLISACVLPSNKTPPVTEVVETLALPPEWTTTATAQPTATKTPSPSEIAEVTTTPSPSPTPVFVSGKLLCPPAGNLTVVGETKQPRIPNDVDILGNYAIVGDNQGLWVFDITDPDKPVDVSFKFVKTSDQIIITETYAYGIDAEGLWMLNLSDPTSPTFLGYKDTPDMPLEFEIIGNYALVRDNYGTLRSFDLVTRANLREIGVYDPPGEILGGDSYGNIVATVRQFERENPLHGFSIHDDYAYVADLDAGLRIVDISDLTRLREIRSYDLSASISDVEIIQDTVFIFGIHQGSETFAWDLWVQNTSDLIKGVEPENLGRIPVPQGTKSEILCEFISDVYRLISESDLEGNITEIQPEEIAGLLKGVDVVDDLIYVADERRGLVIFQFEQQED
jgi:hypothetical protein